MDIATYQKDNTRMDDQVESLADSIEEMFHNNENILVKTRPGIVLVNFLSKDKNPEYQFTIHYVSPDHFDFIGSTHSKAGTIANESDLTSREILDLIEGYYASWSTGTNASVEEIMETIHKAKTIVEAGRTYRNSADYPLTKWYADTNVDTQPEGYVAGIEDPETLETEKDESMSIERMKELAGIKTPDHDDRDPHNYEGMNEGEETDRSSELQTLLGVDKLTPELVNSQWAKLNQKSQEGDGLTPTEARLLKLLGTARLDEGFWADRKADFMRGYNAEKERQANKSEEPKTSEPEGEKEEPKKPGILKRYSQGDQPLTRGMKKAEKFTNTAANKLTKGVSTVARTAGNIGKDVKGAVKVLPGLEEEGYEQEDESKWIQGAVNPSHKGYCSPMSKSTCTPRRAALARRFKKGIEEAEEPSPEYKKEVEKADRELAAAKKMYNDRQPANRAKAEMRKKIESGNWTEADIDAIKKKYGLEEGFPEDFQSNLSHPKNDPNYHNPDVDEPHDTYSRTIEPAEPEDITVLPRQRKEDPHVFIPTSKAVRNAVKHGANEQVGADVVADGYEEEGKLDEKKSSKKHVAKTAVKAYADSISKAVANYKASYGLREDMQDEEVYEKMVSESLPPGFGQDEKHWNITHKLKKQYGHDNPKVFATAWALHRKVHEEMIDEVEKGGDYFSPSEKEFDPYGKQEIPGAPKLSMKKQKEEPKEEPTSLSGPEDSLGGKGTSPSGLSVKHETPEEKRQRLISKAAEAAREKARHPKFTDAELGLDQPEKQSALSKLKSLFNRKKDLQESVVSIMKRANINESVISKFISENEMDENDGINDEPEPPSDVERPMGNPKALPIEVEPETGYYGKPQPVPITYKSMSQDDMLKQLKKYVDANTPEDEKEPEGKPEHKSEIDETEEPAKSKELKVGTMSLAQKKELLTRLQMQRYNRTHFKGSALNPDDPSYSPEAHKSHPFYKSGIDEGEEGEIGPDGVWVSKWVKNREKALPKLPDKPPKSKNPDKGFLYDPKTLKRDPKTGETFGTNEIVSTSTKGFKELSETTSTATLEPPETDVYDTVQKHLKGVPTAHIRGTGYTDKYSPTIVHKKSHYTSELPGQEKEPETRTGSTPSVDEIKLYSNPSTPYPGSKVLDKPSKEPFVKDKNGRMVPSTEPLDTLAKVRAKQDTFPALSQRLEKESEVDEMTTSGAAGPYASAGAFNPDKKALGSKRGIAGSAALGYTVAEMRKAIQEAKQNRQKFLAEEKQRLIEQFKK